MVQYIDIIRIFIFVFSVVNTHAMMSEFANKRWAEMWEKGIGKGERFDTGCSSPVLVQLIKANDIPNGRCLVPGCGRAYDLAALASPKRKVLGIDIVEIAVKEAQLFLTTDANIPTDCDVEVSLTNFFDVKPNSNEEKFDFVYDYTFLCALDPSIRKNWATQMSNIIKPKGELLTLIYPIRSTEGGPPFSVSLELYNELLIPQGFECTRLEMLPTELCHTGREGLSGIGRWIKSEN